jgi:hypothetical protein
MAHGGRREGAGRKPGTANVLSRAVANGYAADGGLTPLDYMMEVLRDKQLPGDVRLDAAKAAAPYVHPRLNAIEHSGALAVLHEKALDELE